MGVMEGGLITISGSLTISTAAGFGYLENSINPGVYERIDWVDSNLILSANTNNYIYFNNAGTLVAAGSEPDSTQNIILGRVVANGTGIEFIDQSAYDGTHMSNKLSKFNREALGPVFSEGSIVTENVTPFKLDVTQGNYFFSENNFTPAGTSSINLNRYYISGSGWNRSTSSIIPNNVYASGSALVPMSSSYYTKHTVYLVGEGINEAYFLVVNDNQYSGLVAAESAGLPTIPTYFNDGVVPLAAVYVQSGSANITQIEDIRPVIGFRAAGVNASAIHGNLLGLTADDHLQYFRVDGTRQMSGNLGLGGNNLYNFSIVSGSNVSVINITASFANITSITGSLLGNSSTSTSSSYSLNATSASISSFATNIPNNLKTARFEIGVSSNAAITTGAKGRKTVPYSGSIIGWKLISDLSTTTTVDIWKTNNAIPTGANSITGSAPISLTASQLNTSTTLTGWTTTVLPNDVFILYVGSNNNANYIALELDILLS
jgi:hypothetical protein